MGCAPGENSESSKNAYDAANLAQTYSALMCLAILRDDFSRVDREGILNTLRNSISADGGFLSQGKGSESDMRFVFCAVACASALNGIEEAIDRGKITQYLRRCLTYDGAFGQTPGGSTYCAVATLSLLNQLWDGSVLKSNDISRLIRWAVLKQEAGFHGRANKPDDSCYAFWIGATLKILDAFNLCGFHEIRNFLLSVQHAHLGGFCKHKEPGANPDILHTYMSLAALTFMREPRLQPIDPALNVSRRFISRFFEVQIAERPSGSRS